MSESKNYIHSGSYKNLTFAEDDRKTEEMLGIIEKYCNDMKADEFVIYDYRPKNMLTEFMVVCSGMSTAHVNGIAEKVLEEMKRKGFLQMGYEGFQEKTWILIDYGSIVLHIFEIDRRSEIDPDSLFEERLKEVAGKK